MRPLVLDERLSRAAALFPACEYGADIGADHGRLSCFLLESGKAERMCVADISAPSLEKAKSLLALRGLTARADLRVGDGLAELPRPAQSIAILGMGARTLSAILLAGRDQLRGASLVLSAHTEIQAVRAALVPLRYRIAEEQIALAAGRHYVVLLAVPGEESYTERQLFLGPRLMETLPEHYDTYLAFRLRNAARQQTERARREEAWLKEEEERVRYSQGH